MITSDKEHSIKGDKDVSC